MGKFTKLLAFIAVLSASILVHEVGHYVTMRAYGIQVVRFTIGFGPTLWSRTLPDGVEFAIKPIILGGFTEAVEEGPGSLEAASDAAKYAVAFSGTAVNAVTAFILLIALGYAGVIGPSKRAAHRLRGVPSSVRPLVAAGAMAFGAWLLGPFVIARDYLRELFGRTVDHKSQRWNVTKGTTPLRDALIDVLALAAGINASLAMFNMLPFRPLDGGGAASLVIGSLLGAGAQHAFDRWSFLALINLVLLKWFVEAFRSRRA